MRGGGRRQIYRDPGWKYPGPTYHGPRYPRPSPRPSRPRGGGGRAALVVLLLVAATVIFVVRGPAALQRPLQGLAQRVTSLGQSGGAKLQVAGTAPSACMAYGPTGPSKNQTVFVDPGHGGADPGAMGQTSSGSQVLEKQATLAVAEALETRLTDDGYRVVLSRTQDTLVADGLGDSTLSVSDEIRDLQARVDCANAAKAVALVSIHFNSFGNSSTGGTETFYDDVRPFAAQNQVLAQDVQSALVRSLGLQNRGITSDDQLNVPTTSGDGASYGHLFLLGPPQAGLVARASSMPGTLTEPLFVSEPAEADLVTSGSGQQQVADSIANGVETFLQKR